MDMYWCGSAKVRWCNENDPSIRWCTLAAAATVSRALYVFMRTISFDAFMKTRRR